MNLTNQEIFNAKAPLEKLLAEKPPFEVSYGLATLASKLNDQLGIIDKVRKGLFETYGESLPQNPTSLQCLPAIEDTDDKGNGKKDKDGNPILIPNPKFPKFNSEMAALMAKEVEVVFDVVEIPSDVELKIEPAILLNLLKFIKMVKK